MRMTIIEAVHILQAGGLVAFPTETVYGLGADATNPEALRKIFMAKERPIDHPLIVHLAHPNQLLDWAVDVSHDALLLADIFWPGPLTLILKKAPHVLDLVTGGQDTIGLRIPNHPVALELLAAIGTGLAAPSANRFGRISPTTAGAVREELADKVDLVLEGGECAVGLESTIVDMRAEMPVILRPGMITQGQLEAVLKKPVIVKEKTLLRVSGNLESHYAPNTPLRLMTAEDIQHFIQSGEASELPCVILARHVFSTRPHIDIVSMSDDPQQYAHDLYRILRAVDKKQVKQIIVESVPCDLSWAAIDDRLARASQKK